jgi:ribA/ribD-fused uncharacterized protein
MEKALSDTRVVRDLREFVDIANGDDRAELEAKVLPGRIRTRDVADRIRSAIEKLTVGKPVEEHRLTYTFKDGTRVNVLGPDNIHRVCVTQSFSKIPVLVERKVRYFQVSQIPSGAESKLGERDVLDVNDFYTRFTLRSETPLRKDYSGPVQDPNAYIRVLHRTSYTTASGEFRIDFSQVKSKQNGETLTEVLKLPPTYELEIEYLAPKTPRSSKEVIASLLRLIERILGAYQNTHFVLPETRLARYLEEFKLSGNVFYNLVTLERRHLRADRVGNILKGYTVTNKADGLRCGLYVARDRNVIRVTAQGSVSWTGITATSDEHIEDFVDGEFMEDKNLFCIFDVYHFRSKNTKVLPLFTTDEDMVRNPMSSRLGCGRQFVEDLRTKFTMLPSDTPMRIETKMFLAGDGPMMEQAIQTILDTQFEYATDGLIFTPRATQVAPIGELRGQTWQRVYKWKPPHENTIDFLMRFDGKTTTYDNVLKQDVRLGKLFVSRNPGQDIVYPCETMTGEYVPPTLPADLQRIVLSGVRAPSIFQPGAPRDPDAYQIAIPVNEKGVPTDIHNRRIEDDTIIECSYNVDTRRWSIKRTRYDKTYDYRVRGQPQYGNDIAVADNVWTTIHVPVTEDMLRAVASNPPDDTFEDDLYYRDDLDSRTRILKQVYGFHNRIKEQLYQSYALPGNTLIEFACGRGGDLFKWKRSKLSKVVGLDYSQTNLTMPRQGACARYLNEKAKKDGFLPKVLFVQADMTKPLEDQDNKYLNIVLGKQEADTPYLREFASLTKFDVGSCQFAIHYACESEEIFKVFVENVRKHCDGIFFGTCMDGAAVYSLLAGKDRHVFRRNSQVFAEIGKKYDDAGTWTPEFGQQVEVMLESLEKPQLEYLVPFERVIELFAEAGFELISSEPFGEFYAQQKGIALAATEQDFSFLYKTFVFKKVRKTEEKVEEVEVAVVVEEQPPAEEPKPEEEAPKPAEEPKPTSKRRKRIVPKEEAPPPAPGEEPVMFFSKLPENKEFSNFYAVDFMMDGVEMKSAEHAFQYYKAKTFGDEVHAEKILKAKSAQSAKSFGKKVANFDVKVWDEKKDDVMRQIIRAKFSVPELRAKLLETGTRPMVEANPRDSYWGIGTSKIDKPEKWGQNKLGKILEEVRAQLKSEE